MTHKINTATRHAMAPAVYIFLAFWVVMACAMLMLAVAK